MKIIKMAIGFVLIIVGLIGASVSFLTGLVSIHAEGDAIPTLISVFWLPCVFVIVLLVGVALLNSGDETKGYHDMSNWS